jgi:cell division protein FtsI/penicillin-binding protein 2
MVAGAQRVSEESPRDVARGIYERVMRVRDIVEQYRGFDAPVAEERQAHAVVGELDAQQQIAAREVFARYPWVHVVPASTRTFGYDAKPFAHLLGRLGRVDADDVATDPAVDDPFASYQADERIGITGVEHLAERTLRGRRGEVTIDRDGTVLDEIEAENGRDVVLTIHAPLQRRLYRLLGETVRQHEASSGGAIVVLDVPTREVLALVSYPSYDPARFDEEYPRLRDDTERLPLRFRAVSNRYPPGSTVKPLACLAGLINRRITLDSREHCSGYLFDDVRGSWRCWQVHGTDIRKAHGDIDVVEALTGSCNVFMFRLGQSVGVDRLCATFEMAGVGRTTGIGLREENRGINPTPDWLMTNKNTPVTPGTARLFAIGQGEIAMTPVQVANLFAVYASGRWRPVTLVPTEERVPEWKLPATGEQWNAIRRGIYGVVNDPSGTAHKYAYFKNERYALCGKTGSATAHPWPTSYSIPYIDENGAEESAVVRAGAERQATEDFQRRYPLATFDPTEVEVASRWPPIPPAEGSNHSHAWFGGFLQPVHPDGRPDWSQAPQVAFAVLVEFGGSGGRTSGPLAKHVAAELLQVLGPDLNVRPAFDEVASP